MPKPRPRRQNPPRSSCRTSRAECVASPTETTRGRSSACRRSTKSRWLATATRLSWTWSCGGSRRVGLASPSHTQRSPASPSRPFSSRPAHLLSVAPAVSSSAVARFPTRRTSPVCAFLSCEVVNYTAGPNEVTIISATTPNRLPFLPSLLKRWPGSRLEKGVTRRQFSIAVKVKLDEEKPVLKTLRELSLPDRVRLILYRTRPKHKRYLQFPVNKLRNLAIVNIVTTHFLVLDMDMWPIRRSAGDFSSRLALPGDQADSEGRHELQHLRCDRPRLLPQEGADSRQVRVADGVCAGEREAFPCHARRAEGVHRSRRLSALQAQDDHACRRARRALS